LLVFTGSLMLVCLYRVFVKLPKIAVPYLTCKCLEINGFELWNVLLSTPSIDGLGQSCFVSFANC